MPVNLHLVTAVGDELITALRVAQPRSQVFLRMENDQRSGDTIHREVHTFVVYGSGSGSWYVSSKLAYRSISVNRFK